MYLDPSRTFDRASGAGGGRSSGPMDPLRRYVVCVAAWLAFNLSAGIMVLCQSPVTVYRCVAERVTRTLGAMPDASADFISDSDVLELQLTVKRHKSCVNLL